MLISLSIIYDMFLSYMYLLILPAVYSYIFLQINYLFQEPPCEQIIDVAKANTVDLTEQNGINEAKEEPMETRESREATEVLLVVENITLSTSELNTENEAQVSTSELKIENELSTSVEERLARERLSTSELQIEGEELEELEEFEDEDEVEPLDNDVDDLSLPAIKRRPTRIIKPVVDKETAVKFVNSDDSSDEEDLEWDDEGKAVEESGSEKDSSSDSSDESACDEEDEGGDLSTFVSVSQEAEVEEKKRVQITEADMPFLFEKRAPGKRSFTKLALL